jgi:hypothetical protein
MKRTCRSSARMPRPICHARDPMTDDVTGQRREALGRVGVLHSKWPQVVLSRRRGERLNRHIPFVAIILVTKHLEYTLSPSPTVRPSFLLRCPLPSKITSPKSVLHLPASPCRTSRILKLTALPMFVFTAYEAHQRDRRD